MRLASASYKDSKVATSWYICRLEPSILLLKVCPARSLHTLMSVSLCSQVVVDLLS